MEMSDLKRSLAPGLNSCKTAGMSRRALTALLCCLATVALAALTPTAFSAQQSGAEDERTRYAYFVEALPGGDAEAADGLC